MVAPKKRPNTGMEKIGIYITVEIPKEKMRVPQMQIFCTFRKILLQKLSTYPSFFNAYFSYKPISAQALIVVPILRYEMFVSLRACWGAK